MTPAITVVIGPTAIGKSAFAHDLARQTGAHIMSADAFQVYKGLSIGTAKPSLADRDEIPYHGIDIRNPDESYSVSDFVSDCRDILSDLARHQIPVIICGGTAFYIYAWLYQFDFSPPSPSHELRTSLTQKWDLDNGKTLWTHLIAHDPECQNWIHPNNRHKVIRALEIINTTGKRPSDYRNASRLSNAHIIGLCADRDIIYDRIHHRVDHMIATGWIDEVNTLLQTVSSNAPSFAAIGYRQIANYLNGSLGYTEMVDLIKTKTRQFAKRQLTWLRKFEDVEWKFIKNTAV